MNRELETKGFDGTCSKCGKTTDIVNLWFRCIDCAEAGDMMMLIKKFGPKVVIDPGVSGESSNPPS